MICYIFGMLGVFAAGILLGLSAGLAPGPLLATEALGLLGFNAAAR